jgi:hypothetical protein
MNRLGTYFHRGTVVIGIQLTRVQVLTTSGRSQNLGAAEQRQRHEGH